MLTNSVSNQNSWISVSSTEMTPKGLLLSWMETSVSYLNLPRKLPANCNVRTAVRHALE
ncbi:MAG: hypothetical protein ACEY3M_04245 [Wolbachia sp.]|uniref:hypothetical protein n=1 Tax=Wolbachia endosymbiont (group A) of Ennomos erosarius TaxID=3066174 RepID=UPI00333F7027